MLGFLILPIAANIFLLIAWTVTRAKLKHARSEWAWWQSAADIRLKLKDDAETLAAENYQLYRKAVTAASTLQDDLVIVSKKYQELKDEVKKRAAQAKVGLTVGELKYTVPFPPIKKKAVKKSK